MGWRFQQPDNELAFEQLCLRLYRKLWKNEGLQLFGKRGEVQNGVDIFDPIGMRPLGAIQCKHHEPTKTIGPAEIEAEVAKAEKSHFRIERFVIATTAKKSGSSQQIIAKLNKRRHKRFVVEIHFWEEICQFASEFDLTLAEFIIYGTRRVNDTAAIAQTESTQFVGDSADLESEQDEPYTTIERLINERQLEIAQHELDKLPSITAAADLTPAIRYKLLRLHAKARLEAGDFQSASRLFLESYSAAPDLVQAKQNQVLAYILANDHQKAYEYATGYVEEGLKTPVMVLRLVDSILTPDQLAEQLSVITPYLGTDDSINMSLSHKYLRFAEYDKAYATACNATALAPDSAQAQLAAAMSQHSAAFHGDLAAKAERLREALSHYDEADVLARQQRFTHLITGNLSQ